MKKKTKPLVEQSWQIEELGYQVEAIGFLLHFHTDSIPPSEANFIGMGVNLESLGRKLQRLGRAISAAVDLGQIQDSESIRQSKGGESK